MVLYFNLWYCILIYGIVFYNYCIPFVLYVTFHYIAMVLYIFPFLIQSKHHLAWTATSHSTAFRPTCCRSLATVMRPASGSNVASHVPHCSIHASLPAGTSAPAHLATSKAVLDSYSPCICNTHASLTNNDMWYVTCHMSHVKNVNSNYISSS